MLLKSLFVATIVASIQLFAYGQKDPPATPTRYVTGIEANIANKNKTYVVIEWYDGELKKGRRRLHYGDYIFTFVEDYSNDTDELWLYLQYAKDDDSDDVLYCALEAYSNQTNRFFNAAGFFGKWLQTDGEMDDATYLGVVGDVDDIGEEDGDYNMRGLLADKWTKDVTWSGTEGGTTYDLDFTVNYYWTVGPSWSYSTYNTSDESPIPLRVEILGNHYSENATGGIQNYTFYHSYEYIGFFAGDDAFDPEELDFYYEMPSWVDECDTSHYCQHYPTADVCSDSQGPDLPELSNRFLMTVEINDKIQNISYLMREYYDYNKNRAHLIFYYDNTYGVDAFHQLQLDNELQRWYWLGDESDTSRNLQLCQMDLVDENYTGYDLFIPEMNGHIASTASAFHLNSSQIDNKVWMGYTTVRNGIHAEKWKGIWQDEYVWVEKFYVIVEADSYYYFNRDTWSMSTSNYSQDIPIRFEIAGRYTIWNLTDDDDTKVLWLNDTFDVSYDMIGFSNGNLEDSHFTIPDNWREDCTISEEYCNDARFSDSFICEDEPELPVLPPQFETTIECVFVSKNYTMIADEFYDYTNNREKLIYYPFTWRGEYPVNYSRHYLELGASFWDWKQGNGLGLDSDGSTINDCSLTLAKDVNTNNPELYGVIDQEREHVSTTKLFYDWVANNSVQTYVGKKNVGGILCNRWKHKIQHYEFTFNGSDGVTYGYETNMTVIYAFMADEFKQEAFYGEWGIPVRADVTGNTRISPSNGYAYEYDYEHYYNYVKFLPGVPDDTWFESPDNWRDDCTVSESYCNDARFSDSYLCQDEPELPVLPPQFETTVECVFVSKNYTMVVDEYYDFTNNRERVITYPFTFRGQYPVNYSSHYLEDGEIFWSWRQGNGLGVDSDGSTVNDCELTLTKNIDTSNGLLGFFNADSEHVSTTKVLFDWVANSSVQTYVGRKNVGGILSDRWKHKIQHYEVTFNGSDGITYTYETNMTVVYSFMADEFKSEAIYGDWGIPVRADVTGTTSMTPSNGYGYSYDYEHYYVFVRFIPSVPDDFWFKPPTNVSCNITKYCAASSSFNIESSSEESDDGVDGASSEEFSELCDEADENGNVFIEAGAYDTNTEDCDDETRSMNNTGFWVVAVLLWILFSGICFFFGQYRERQAGVAKVRLPDDNNL